MTSISRPSQKGIPNPRKLDLVVEILGILEEQHKSKDWILHQIKQRKERISLRPTLTTAAVLRNCSSSFLSHIYHILKDGDLVHLMGPPPLTKTYHWFFTDIVDSSNPSITTNEQAYKIIALNALIEQSDVFKNRNPKSTIILPTGDGMAMGFSDTPEKPLNLAIQVHKNIKKYNEQLKSKEDKLQIRIGLDRGQVYIIRDLNGHENVWGPGIILARRIMDLARPMNILASDRFANDVKTLRPEYRKILHLAGEYPIKHGQTMLIYNVYDDEIGSNKAPLQTLRKSKADEEVRRSSSRFRFLQANLELEILDTKSMLTHHSLEWNLINISQDPIIRIFFYLFGETPKTFPELNMIIKDEGGKELEIMSINVNKPFKKEFFVRLKKPLNPNERGRKVKFEWDWEEPDRQYSYRLSTDCAKFFFRLLAPKEFAIKPKIVRDEMEIGEKVHAAVPPAVRFLKDKTEVTWTSSNLKMFDAYRFDW